MILTHCNKRFTHTFEAIISKFDVLGDIGVAGDDGNVSGVGVQQTLVVHLHDPNITQPDTAWH